MFHRYDAPRDSGILGQPRGIGTLVFVEGWLNFSIYGTRILLVLYMTRALLLPGHGEHVLGLGAIRAGFEHAYGPLSTAALASAIFGLFSSLIYLTPLAGAFLADRWLGRARAIVLGTVLAAAGNGLLLLDAGFFPGLLCILAGIGLAGGNLLAQMGELYERDDPRRGDGFQLCYLAIDAAVVIAPLICGTLGEEWGFGYGFAAAGLGMLVALGAYLYGRRWLPADPPLLGDEKAVPRPPIGRRGWQAVAVLLALIPVIGLASVANNQIYGAYELWGAAHYDLVFFGHAMPVTWLLSVDAFISFGCGFVVLALWRWLEHRDRLPSEITRCAIGAFLSAGATLVLALAAWVSHDGKVGLAWGLAFHTINNLGVTMLFPLTLALYSRAAPGGLSATMINSSKLNFFVSFQMVGWLGGFVDQVSGTRFWLMHAGVVGAAGGVLLLAGWIFRALLGPGQQDEQAA
jgi:proton-dependent oligopeptide transporter, POT family